MEPRRVIATVRQQGGKGPARRLRAQEKIPAIAYGKDIQSMALVVSPKDLLDVLESERGRNSVIQLDVEGGGPIQALLADFQYHPVSRQLLHADFLQIRPDEPVDVDIPFELTGRAKGVVLGGTLRQVFRKLPVRCLPKDIPVKIEHDVTELGLDAHVAVKDLALPQGVAIRLDVARTVAAIITEKRRGGDAESEGEAEAAPAKTAPAKPAAKS